MVAYWQQTVLSKNQMMMDKVLGAKFADTKSGASLVPWPWSERRVLFLFLTFEQSIVTYFKLNGALPRRSMTRIVNSFSALPKDSEFFKLSMARVYKYLQNRRPLVLLLCYYLLTVAPTVKLQIPLWAPHSRARLSPVAQVMIIELSS